MHMSSEIGCGADAATSGGQDYLLDTKYQNHFSPSLLDRDLKSYTVHLVISISSLPIYIFCDDME